MRTYKSILLIDDDPASLYLHQALLAEFLLAGQVEVKQNGEEAFQYLRQRVQEVATDDLPEVLLLDISMPVRDGFEFLEACRKEGLFQQWRPGVVLVTSSSRVIDQGKASAYDVVDYLLKPLTREKLISAFSKLSLRTPAEQVGFLSNKSEKTTEAGLSREQA